MSYLDLLREEFSETFTPEALQKLQKDPFYSFCSSPSRGFPEIKPAVELMLEAARNDPKELAASISDFAAYERRERVLAMLDRSPGIKRALITDTRSDPEDVILTVGIRDLGTAELRIPKANYDAFAIMKAVETLQ
jgi:hypothetical protein